LGRFLWRERIEILHAHHGRDYWTSILAARTSGRRVKVVLSRHLATAPRGGSRWFLLTGCDCLITVSQFVDQGIRDVMLGNKSKIHQVYGGIDTNAFGSAPPERAAAYRQSQGWKPEDIVCGVVGTFSFPHGKGQPEFLQAAQRLHSEHPNARFAMIGNGSMKTFLEQEIRRLNLGDVAKLIPYSFEMPVVMSALDVLVHPAIGTEALGLVLWEAMASGKPVVASRLGGIPEAFVENEHGILVPPGGVEALAKALDKLLTDQALRARLGAAGREHVRERFSRTRQARGMMEVYSSLTSCHK
jgi:glycosyltransferase involved in cell wall biosynthesis